MNIFGTVLNKYENNCENNKKCNANMQKQEQVRTNMKIFENMKKKEQVRKR